MLTISVEVKNLADPADPSARAGADVVELYYAAPYIKGGIEKPVRVLAAFRKTGVIAPGESETVTFTLAVRDMASYDCYDKNQNGHTGYELDVGEYAVMLMKNAHEVGKMSETCMDGGASAAPDGILCYTIAAADYDTDPVTGEAVVNRFTNADGKGNDQTVDASDLDGSHEETAVRYLSRADFKATYPVRSTPRNRTEEAARISRQLAPTAEQLAYSGDTGAKRTAKANGMTFADILDVEDYDDPAWEQLIANITDGELVGLISDGYFKTAAIGSIGKAQYVDLDGPLGFNTRVTGGNGTTCSFMAYPSATLLAQTWNTELAEELGRCVGRERKSMAGLRGWYAPGANTHRNPFGGRNGEYYSEDAVLSGYMCAGTVKGAKELGVYSYVKHFVANDSEYSREGLFTFLTEQALRETYLKPFEIMIKEGGGNALMTSMNRLGRVWSGANYGLVNEIARGEWGFRGTIVTDWMNSGEDYMPPYRGIWAGNDIWLTNGITDTVFDSVKTETGYKIAEHVAHDVLWTLTDTFRAEKAFDPTVEIDLTEGASYNNTWVWYIVLVELVLAAGIATMGYFLVRALVRGKKGAPAAQEAREEAEGSAQEDASGGDAE